MNNDVNAKWPKLPVALKKIAIDPTSDDYELMCSNYFVTGRPKLILRATTERDVIASIQYVKKIRENVSHSIPFSFRSGGHGISMASVNDGGIILDISQLNSVTVTDAEQGLVQVQAGAVWGDVAEALRPFNLIISSGDFGDTGVGGLATGGGIGLLVRRLGLTIDHIVSARLVTADGEIRVTDHQKYPDLFWGIRGGNSQLGMVTAFTFKASKLVEEKSDISLPFTVQTIESQTSNLTKFIQQWQSWITHASSKMSSNLMLTAENRNTVHINASNFWAGSINSDAKALFKSALSLSEVNKHQLETKSYAELVKAPHIPHSGQQPVFVKNILLDAMNPNIGDIISKILVSPGIIGIEMRAIDGPLNTINADETAWHDRKAKVFLAMWLQKDTEPHAKEVFGPLQDLGTGVYSSYSSDLSIEESQRIWPEETGRKLRKLITKYDPQHLFNQGHYW